MSKKFQIEKNLYFIEKTSTIVIRYKGKDKSTKLKSELLIGKDKKALKTKKGYFRVKNNLQEAIERRDNYIGYIDNPEKYQKEKVEQVQLSTSFEQVFNECIKQIEKKVGRGQRTRKYAKERKDVLNAILPFFKKKCKYVANFKYTTWDDLADWAKKNKIYGLATIKIHFRYTLAHSFKMGYIPHPFAGENFEIGSKHHQETVRSASEKIVAIEDHEFYKLLDACEPGEYKMWVQKKLGGAIKINSDGAARTTKYELKMKYEGNPDLRDQLIIMHDAGTRPGRETLALKFSYFIDDPYIGKVIKLPPKVDKNKKGRLIPITERVWNMVKEREKRYGNKSPYLFPMRKFVQSKSKQQTLWDQHSTCNKDNFRRCVKRAKLDRPITPNFIRHKFISDMCSLIKAGELSVSDVALMAGNSTKTIEKHYLHMNDSSAQKLRKAAESRYKKHNIKLVK